jgi:hypothetical protein
MKRIVFFIFIFLAFIRVNAQEIKSSAVPERVIGRMLFTFPNVNDDKIPVKWEKEGYNYKATISYKGGPAIIVIDTLAKAHYIERWIPNEQLPSKTVDALKAQYPDCTISRATKITDQNNKDVYKVSIVIKPVITLDPDGKILKSTMK